MNRATFGTNIRPPPAATRNHSHIPKASNSRKTTPALRERLSRGVDGAPGGLLRRMCDGASARRYAMYVRSPAR
jgi:hypothetical protein